MKQFFLIPTCALVAAVTVTSCQREEKSCVELATELTLILKKVNDFESAEAAAPAVKVYMERLSAALGRPVAHGGSALYKSESGELKNALEELARQIARVRASYPEQMQAATFQTTDENQAASEAPIDAAVKALTLNVTQRLQGEAATAFAKYAANTITDAEKDQLVSYSKELLKTLAETQAGMAEIAALGKVVNVSDAEEESEESEEEESVAAEDVDAGDASAVDAYLKKCMKEQQSKYNAAYAAKAEAVLSAVQSEHYDAVIKSASRLINTLVSYQGGESSEIPNGFVPSVKYMVDSSMGDASDEEKAARLNRISELVTVISAERLLLQKNVTPVRVAEVCFSTVNYMVDNNINVETDDSLIQHLGANLGVEAPAEGEEEGAAGNGGQIKTSRAAESLAQGNVYLNTFAPNTSSGTTYAPTTKDPVNDMEGADGKVIAFAECYGSVALQEAFGDFIRLGEEDASTKPVIDQSIWSFDGDEAAPAAPEVDWNAVNAARKAVETTDAPAPVVVEGETVTETTEEPATEEEETTSDDSEEESSSEEETDTEEPSTEEEETSSDDEEETDSEEPAVEEEEETTTEEETSDESATEEEEEPAAEEETTSDDSEEPAVEEEEETSSDEEETSSDESSDEEEISSDEEEDSGSDDDFGFGDIEF